MLQHSWTKQQLGNQHEHSDKDTISTDVQFNTILKTKLLGSKYKDEHTQYVHSINGHRRTAQSKLYSYMF